MKRYEEKGINYLINKPGGLFLDRCRQEFRYGHRIEYTYDASGMKRTVKYREANHNMNYSPWDTREPAESDFLPSPLTKNYTGNKVYENGNLKLILTENGYIKKSGTAYNRYYYLKDHLGNTRVVLNASGTPVQITNYYPSGTTMAEAPARTDQGIQPYKFGGKELDRSKGLDFYDYEARQYDPTLMRFTAPDPLAEKYYAISPYSYCLNNPVRFVDKDGRDPGDVFRTKDDAAKDWGKYYNGASIVRGREFASSLYNVGQGYGKNRIVSGYSYSIANEGGPDGVKPSTPPKGGVWEGSIHSHGNHDERYDNDNFSEDDIDAANRSGYDSYLATPEGSLKKYDPNAPEGKKEFVLSTDLPKDKKYTGKDPVETPNLKYNPVKEEDAKPKYFNN